MDIALIIIGVILLISGIIGCVVPFPPGPPLSYCSLILLQFTRRHPFSEMKMDETTFLIVWAIVIVIITILDYYVSIRGPKQFGGTKGGTWGATIGLIVGIFFSPIGILMGLFLGAFIGEIVNRQSTRVAFKSAIGAFLGFLAGTFMKLVVCFVLAFYFVRGML
jgi:uncharacterized protein YqgC (DUF456 family)